MQWPFLVGRVAFPWPCPELYMPPCFALWTGKTKFVEHWLISSIYIIELGYRYIITSPSLVTVSVVVEWPYVQLLVVISVGWLLLKCSLLLFWDGHTCTNCFWFLWIVLWCFYCFRFLKITHRLRRTGTFLSFVFWWWTLFRFHIAIFHVSISRFIHCWTKKLY